MYKTLIAGGMSAVLALGACIKDASTKDYRSQTEKFLESDKKVETQAGQTFTGAKCETPASTTVGTTYTCTALGADGKQYTFDVAINTKNSFLVQTIKPVDASTGDTATSVAGSVPVSAPTT